MVHISRLIVRNFRGIENADIHFREGLNVLVGRNGSGKSSVLHAIRLLFDSSLSNQQRILEESDVYGDVGFGKPANVVIAAKLSGFDDAVRQDQANRLVFKVAEEHSAWIVYWFRPKASVRVALADKTRDKSLLNSDDYDYDGLVRFTADPTELEWDDAVKCDELRERELSALTISDVPALRDVVEAIRRERTSPLARLLDTFDVPKQDRDAVQQAYLDAQKVVEGVTAFSDLAREVLDTYEALTQEDRVTFRLGVSPPSFSAIRRGLGILISDSAVSDMELHRNGLGLNNLLFIAMLLRRFDRGARRAASPILLFEEPEAHLHPQAQSGVMGELIQRRLQTIVTTHSPYVAMSGGLDAVINLDRADAVKGSRLSMSAGFTDAEIDDLERFLSLDRGTTMFARTILLVEGPSERILIGAYARVRGVNLSRLGVQVCSIDGIHFGAYEKLFGPNGLNKRRVSVRDGDAQNSAERKLLPLFDDGSNTETVDPDRFVTACTLEYALTQFAAIPALLRAIIPYGEPTLVETLRQVHGPADVTGELQRSMLRAIIRIGKARFAQSFAREIISHNLEAPAYIDEAITRVVRGSEATVIERA